MRIYLIGFMGSGKTHTGKKLAEELGFLFLDLDLLIEAEAGMDIAEIFEQFGETHFREMERQALHFTADLEEVVISTGGGTPCFFDNIEWMNQHGTCIFLDTPARILAERLLPEREHRPLLRPYDETTLPDFIQSKLEERMYFYRQATIIFSQDEAEADLTGALIERLNEQH
ncbi:MAG: shikimate kinase [Saprospiraceae bacterium]|nr:AAA family ATPase [Lewinella sp.]